MTLTNDGKPHKCGEIQTHRGTMERAALCSVCSMPVDPTTPIEAMKERIVYERGAFGVDPDKLAAELVRLEEKIEENLPRLMTHIGTEDAPVLEHSVNYKIGYQDGYNQGLLDVEEGLADGTFNSQPSLFRHVMRVLSSLRDKQK